ncbi:sugar transferase [Sphingomonas crusticola]|uniref:sugar transferase n=1 Tax=Sphingomonas crusticola TaxID=1697973 RepID=UPI000E225A18|nr:sugar transferase [Sphingomonas crusticola]
MRILIISQWFDPEPTFKGLLFARELKRLGHEVEVLTGYPNYPGGKLYPGYRLRLFQRDTTDGIRILRVPLYPSHDGSALRRALNYLSFALAATLGTIFVRRPDIAYVYHPPATVALPAMVLKHLRGVPFVYDVQDLWPESLSATGMVRGSAILDLVRAGMRRIYRSAAHIVVLSDGFRATLGANGVPEQRVSVIPNWTHQQDAGTAAERAQAPALRPDARFNIMFAGTMGRAQALETVLQAAKALQDRAAAIDFTFVGGGIESAKIRELTGSMDLRNVRFLGQQPSNAMAPIFAAADALLVHLKDDPLFAVTIPSKTQAYLQAGKPILMGVRGDAARMVEEAGAGIAFPPQDPHALVEAALAMAELSEPERRQMGQRGALYYAERLSLPIGAQAFSAIFEAQRYSWRRGFALKRLMDVCAASLALIVLAIPMLIIARRIASIMGRPVFFRQERPGRDGVPFNMLKFRTMTDECDASGNLLPDSHRLTPLGAWLRRTSLDELPELVNVVRGDMSLVGPRPLLMRYTKFFSREERLRLTVRPGITGLAQTSGRNAASWDKRLGLDVRYVKHWSLLLDIRILAITVLHVFSRRDVVVDPVSIMQDLDEERQAGGR